MLYFLLALAVLLLPFSFRLGANTGSGFIELRAEYLLFGKIRIKLYKSKLTVKKTVKSLLSHKKSKPGKARIFTSVKNHISVDSLKIDSKIGTGSAASTALLSGQAFSLFAPVAAIATRNKNCFVRIDPVFDDTVFDFTGEMIISTNIANALLAVLEIIKKEVAYGKTSDRKHNDDYNGKLKQNDRCGQGDRQSRRNA